MTEVIVTGGLGFLGLQFAKRILRGGVAWSPLTKQASKLETLTLVDPVSYTHLTLPTILLV